MNFIVFDILAFTLSTIVVLYQLKKNNNYSLLIISVLFYAFYVLPIGLDYGIAFPEYLRDRSYGFFVSFKDPATRIIYDFFLMWTYYLFYKHCRKTKPIEINTNEIDINNVLFWGMIISPFLTLFVLRMPGYLYVFQWREGELFPYHHWYTYVEELAYVGVCCSILLLFSIKGSFQILKKICTLLICYTNICIEGKRGILFFAIVFAVIVLVVRSISNNKNKQIKARRDKSEFNWKLFFISIFSAIAGIVMVVSSVMVKTERGYAEDLLYETLRIDFFRDDRIRMAIFSEIYPERMHILDYYFQTFIHNIGAIWPINLLFVALGWPRESYQQYISSALEGTRVIGDGFMTPSFSAEMISNMGLLLGGILTSYLCIWFAKQTGKYSYPLNVLIISAFLMLNMFSVNYIMPYLEFVFILCIIYRNKNKKNEVINCNTCL